MTKRLVLARVGVILAGLMVAIAAGELALDVLYPMSDEFWQPDARLGHVHVPGKIGVWRSSCYAVTVRINGWGFRGPAWSLTKPPGVTRIIVLGDSLTEALQVPYEDTFPARLERRLNQAGNGRRFEVLNLGVSLYSTGQNYLNLVHHGLRFAPDLVLLGFSIATDVREESSVLNGRGDKPYFRVGSDGLQLHSAPAPARYHAVKQAIRRSRLYQLVGSRIATSSWGRPVLLQLGLAEPVGPELEREVRGMTQQIPSDFTVYANSYPPAWATAWETVAGVLERAKRDTETHRARFVVFGIPGKVEVLETTQLAARYPTFLERYDAERPHRVLSEIAARHGFPYVSLRPPLRAAVAAGTAVDELFVRCDQSSHLASGGHGIVANSLFDSIAPLLDL